MHLLSGGNQITNLAAVHFPSNLSTLQLEKNQIANIAGANFPHELSKLFLQVNKIACIDRVVFPPTVKCLNLSRNPIKSFQDSTLPNCLEVLHLENTLLDNIKSLKLPRTLQRLHTGTRLKFSQESKRNLFVYTECKNWETEASIRDMVAEHGQDRLRSFYQAMDACWVLRSAHETRFALAHSAARKLPRELVILVFRCLTDVEEYKH